MKNQMRSARRAFTLIELLVVVAIITVLIALLLPTLKKARDQARRAACLSNLHQIDVQLFTYASDSDGAVLIGYSWAKTYGSSMLWQPISGWPPDPGEPNGVFTALGWLYPSGYMAANKLYYCPATFVKFCKPTYPEPAGYVPWPPGTSGFDNQTYSMGYSTRPSFSWPSYYCSAAGYPALTIYPALNPGSVFPRLPKLATLTPGTALLAEPMSNTLTHETGMNVAYADGSAHYVLSTTFKADMATGQSNNNYILGTNANGTLFGVWADFDKQ